MISEKQDFLGSLNILYLNNSTMFRHPLLFNLVSLIPTQILSNQGPNSPSQDKKQTSCVKRDLSPKLQHQNLLLFTPLGECNITSNLKKISYLTEKNLQMRHLNSIKTQLSKGLIRTYKTRRKSSKNKMNLLFQDTNLLLRGEYCMEKLTNY